MSQFAKVLLALLILFTSSCTFKPHEKAVVTATTLNIRRFADVKSSIIGKLNQGDTVTIKSTYENFAIIDYENQQGRVYLDYLERIKPPTSTTSSVKIGGPMDFFFWIFVALIFSFLAWGVLRLGNLITRKLSAFNSDDIPGFYFAAFESNSWLRQLQNLIFGRKQQHPYLSYWLYMAFYSAFIILPVLFTFLLANQTLYWRSVTAKYATLSLITIVTCFPVIVYLIKARRSILLEHVKKEWYAVITGLLMSLPTLITVLFIALLSIIRRLFIAFFNIVKLLTPSKSEWHMIQRINSDDPNDTPYI